MSHTQAPTATPVLVQDPTPVKMNIFLMPGELSPNEANEKARPNETPESRAKRVKEMAASIKANGQELPVLVIEATDDSGNPQYQYIDGGSRVDAIALLNSDPKNGTTKVWCSVVSGDADLFRMSVTSNWHRHGNSILEIGAICQEAAERNGWKGRGTNKKIAEYFNLQESRVTEYLKVAQNATPTLRSMIERGEVGSLEVALRLLSVPEEKKEVITTRALEVAKERAAEQTAATAATAQATAPVADAVPADSTVDPEAVASDAANTTDTNGTTSTATNPTPTTAPAPVKVTTADVRTAATEQGETVGPLSKKELLEFFEEKIGPAYSTEVQAFCEYFVEKYAKGTGTDRTANKLFDAMAFQTKESKEQNKVAAKAAADAAKAEAKAELEKQKLKDKEKAEKAKAKGKK